MEIQERDLRQFVALQSLLKGARLDVMATDTPIVGETMLWLKDFAARVGKSYQETRAAQAQALAAPKIRKRRNRIGE